MGMHTICHDATFKLSKPHQINFLRIGGFWTDKLQVRIDGHIVLDKKTGSTIDQNHKQIHNFILDELPVEIWWQYNSFGDPRYIALIYNGSVLAKYGSGKEIENLNSQIKTINNQEKFRDKIEILGENEKDNDIRIISKEDFPLDNRKGSGILTTEYKIQKTLSSQLTLENNINTNIGINLDTSILNLIKAEISADLSTRIEQSVNQTITREDNLTFSVQPGDFVIYTIIWKCINRSGEYLIGINREFMRFNYEVQFGLSYSIESKNLTQSS
jgi:hypothetical protein